MPGQTILIIDDDSTFRTNLSCVLKAAGYKSLEAHDGRTALAAIDQVGTSIDLMIVDLCLPDDVNGLDIILTATRRKLPVKIIAASAVFDQLHLDIAKDFGADAALRKSPDGDVAGLWLELVRRLLGESDSHPAPSEKLVVVADDDDAVRGLVKSILRRAGYQVLEAADGEAALALIEKICGTLDLLVTDCGSNPGTGIGVAVSRK
jgi:CheY-like chemotaxis protein